MRTRTFTLLICSALLSANAIAQLPTYGWTRSLGTLDGLDVIEPTADGRAIVFGTFSGTHDLDLGPGELLLTETGTGTSAFICATDENGTLDWAIPIISTTNVNPTDLHVNADGTILAHGNFRGTLDADPDPGSEFLLNAGTTFDQFIAKYDADGGFLWAVSFGNNQDLSFARMAVDDSGNVFVALSPSSSLDVDPGTNTVSFGPGQGYGLVKLAPDGTFQWVQRIGEISVTSLHTPLSGGVVVVGSFAGTELIGTAPNTISITGNEPFADVCVLRFNAQGLPTSASVFGGSGSENVIGAELHTDGSLNIAGEFTQTTDLDPSAATLAFTASGVYDLFAMKLDPSGVLDWGVAWGHGFSDEMSAMDIDGYGDVYIIAPLLAEVDVDPGPGTTLLQSTIPFNDYLLKLDGATGAFDLAFAMSDGAAGYITTRSIALTPNGSIITGGAFRASTDMDPLGGDDILTVQVDLTEEFYVRRFDQNIGLAIPEATPNTVQLFPVPCTDVVFLAHPENGAARYSIINAQGGIAHSGSLEPGLQAIPVAPLAPGVYVLELFTKDKRSVSRFVKQ